VKAVSELTGFSRVLPMNSGAEAVETALKAARKWGEKVKGVPAGRQEIIAFEHNFSGRTIAIVSFSDEAQYATASALHAGLQDRALRRPEALERAITPDTVAILMEPVQGEAGSSFRRPAR